MIAVFAALTLLTAGCAKKNVAAAPPPPPATASTPPAQKAALPALTATTQRPTATTPAPRYPNAATRERIDQLLAKIEDAYFDYNKASPPHDALKALAADSTSLRNLIKDYPNYKLMIDGHCAERGSD